MPCGRSSAGRGTPSRPARRAAGQPGGEQVVDGESAAPRHATAVTGSYGGWSSAAASSPRHSVSRVQARSVSPGGVVRRRALRAPRRGSALGRGVGDPALGDRAERVVAGTSAGASFGHQATTGASGSSRPDDEASPVRAPARRTARSTTTSLAPASPPTRIWASSRASAPRLSPVDDDDDPARVLAADASLAASMASSASLLVGDDDQGQHPAEGDRAALLAQRRRALA